MAKPTPTTMGRITSESLNKSSIKEISDFFRQSLRHGKDQLSDWEQTNLLNAANYLDEIMSWSEESKDASD